MTYILAFIILVSAVINGLLIWYIRGLLSNYQVLLDSQTSIEEKVNSFADHLKQVYERDSYYGDPTLESLLKHTTNLEKSLREMVVLGGDIYNQQDITNE